MKHAPAPFVALSATFMDDPRVVAAGERAGWLFVAMMLDCRNQRTDGTVTAHRLPRLGVPAWRPRLARLLEVGLVEKDGDAYRLPAYLKWNVPQSEYQRREHRGRVDVCRRHHDQPCDRPACADSREWLATY